MRNGQRPRDAIVRDDRDPSIGEVLRAELTEALEQAGLDIDRARPRRVPDRERGDRRQLTR